MDTIHAPFSEATSHSTRCAAIYCIKYRDDALELQKSLQHQRAGKLAETGKSRGSERQKKPCALASENVLDAALKKLHRNSYSREIRHL